MDLLVEAAGNVSYDDESNNGCKTPGNFERAGVDLLIEAAAYLSDDNECNNGYEAAANFESFPITSERDDDCFSITTDSADEKESSEKNQVIN